MTKRILLAGVLGGFGLFVWGGLSHTVLGLGERGVRPLPKAAAVETLKAEFTQPGFYYFPQADAGKMRPEDVNGPYGILIYHPTGASPGMSRQLANEFILYVVQGLVAAFLLTLAPGLTGYVSRVGFVVLAGLLAGAAMAIEFWNWYGFPADYTWGLIADRIIGFALVGLIVAAFIKPAVVRIQAVPARAA